MIDRLRQSIASTIIIVMIMMMIMIIYRGTDLQLPVVLRREGLNTPTAFASVNCPIIIVT